MVRLQHSQEAKYLEECFETLEYGDAPDAALMAAMKETSGMSTETLLEVRALTMRVERSHRRQNVLSASLLTSTPFPCRLVHAPPHSTHLRRYWGMLAAPK